MNCDYYRKKMARMVEEMIEWEKKRNDPNFNPVEEFQKESTIRRKEYLDGLRANIFYPVQLSETDYVIFSRFKE